MSETVSGNDKQAERLRREHAKLDAKLQELEGRKWLSSVDEAEVKRLKREKLARKDQLRVLHPDA
jgi:hypothetical protein